MQIGGKTTATQEERVLRKTRNQTKQTIIGFLRVQQPSSHVTIDVSEVSATRPESPHVQLIVTTETTHEYHFLIKLNTSKSKLDTIGTKLDTFQTKLANFPIELDNLPDKVDADFQIKLNVVHIETMFFHIPLDTLREC